MRIPHLLALLAVLATAACAAPTAPPAPAAAPASPASPAAPPLEHLRALAAAGACRAAADCRTLPIGARACGGPEAYLPYSVHGTDAATLQALAEQVRAARQADIARTGEQSTCMLTPDPGAECRQQRCVLRQPERQ